MNILNDEYLYALMEQGQEAEIVSECEVCMQELFAGEEVVVDKFGNHFCDEQCGRIFHGIVETTITFGSCCEHCGEVLDAEAYEVYCDVEGVEFCSIECAEEYNEFREIILERN